MNKTAAGIQKRGLVNWILQRVSGLFLVYGVTLHLWAVHNVNTGELTWATISARLQDGHFWLIYYLLFIPALVHHALNGMWSIYLDFAPKPLPRRIVGWLFWIGGTAFIIYGYVGLKPLFAR